MLNVLEDDKYESLEIPYTSIREMDIPHLQHFDSENRMLPVTIFLTSIPTIGHEPFSLPYTHCSADDILVELELGREALIRFCKTMRNRNLVIVMLLSSFSC